METNEKWNTCRWGEHPRETFDIHKQENVMLKDCLYLMHHLPPRSDACRAVSAQPEDCGVCGVYEPKE